MNPFFQQLGACNPSGAPVKHISFPLLTTVVASPRAVNGEESERTRSSSLSPTQPLPKRTDPMLALLEFLDSLPDWMTSWTFILSMAALLIGLIIVLMIVRNKRPEDD
jgi:hypothetical protein